MGSSTNLPSKDVLKETFRLLWQDFTTAFSDRYTLKWSFWWAVAMCGYFQVGNYIQPLWETISPSTSLDGHQTDIYNGGVAALQTFLSMNNIFHFIFFFYILGWISRCDCDIGNWACPN